MGGYFSSKHRSEVASYLREIFDASFWKQARAEAAEDGWRWTLPMLAMTWIAFVLVDRRALMDRFAVAREWIAGVFEKRRRPGKTYQGFASASRVRAETLLQPMSEKLRQISVPFLERRKQRIVAIDGSRSRVPHTMENARAFGQTTIKDRADSAPQLLIVAAVEITQRLLWDWVVSGGNASEPELAARIIERLPEDTLVVKDAGTVSYHWIREVLGGGRHLLMRVAGNFHFWAEKIGATRENGGQIWIWPVEHPSHSPLRLRLIRCCVPHKKGRKKKSCRKTHREIYLLTDLDEHALSDREAGQIYAKRWGASEIGFRSFKQTLGKTTLLSRGPEMALLECQFSLLGMQLLSVLQLQSTRSADRLSSLAQTWRVWRRAIERGLHRSILKRLLSLCLIDNYRRTSQKSRRRPPQQKREYATTPPHLRKLTFQVKQRWRQHFQDPFMLNC